jgi:tetratricopeptide (TPR) repeat protein
MVGREAGSRQTRRLGDVSGTRRKRRSAKSAAGQPNRYPGADAWQLFAAEGAYADSIVKSALGDGAGCLAALRQSLDALPTYAPAILSLGSVEYQRRRATQGRKLFMALLDLPDDTPDLAEIIDEAGDFLIGRKRYGDGLELYRRAAERFPSIAVLHQGRGCCAGHLGRHEEALAASRTALALDPDNQQFTNDLGWSLYGAGRLAEARDVLGRAVAMDPRDELAAENLRLCTRDLEASEKRRMSPHRRTPAKKR